MSLSDGMKLLLVNRVRNQSQKRVEVEHRSGTKIEQGGNEPDDDDGCNRQP